MLKKYDLIRFGSPTRPRQLDKDMYGIILSVNRSHAHSPFVADEYATVYWTHDQLINAECCSYLTLVSRID